MSLRPVARVETNSSSHAERDVRSWDPERDQLVMVIFPQSSWDAVRELASDLKCTPQEVIGASLKLLRQRVDDQQSRG